jgi:carboxymethylenebutenolidase
MKDSGVQPAGYLTQPRGGKVNPVLVLHAWWGLNPTIKTFCQRLADADFTVFAPDLYGGKVADTIDGAKALAGELNSSAARVDVAKAATFLDERAGHAPEGIAVIGFSLGAYFALDLSITRQDLARTVVVFYGTGPIDFGTSRADYLGHFAENDDFEPQSEVDKLENALRQAGRSVTFHRYPGTGHWFFEPDRIDAYNPEAAQLAWNRTLEFLRR